MMETETWLGAWKDFATNHFIPKALIVGALGNLINYVILSRPCIKSTTNIYLSILAFTDTSFLLSIYIYSLRYHDDVHHEKYEIYWRMSRLSHWFYTTFLYITVYLTFTLSLDRYSAVKHPARTKCGIARAKNIVSMVLLLSILFSISAAFEFQLASKNDELCKKSRSQAVEDVTTISAMPEQNQLQDDDGKSLSLAKHDEAAYNFNKEDSMISSHRRLERSLDNDVFLNSMNDSSGSSKLTHKTSHNPTDVDVDHYVNDEALRDNATSSTIPRQNHNTCHSHFTLYPVESSLAKNKFYQAIFKSTATILLVLPIAYTGVLGGLLSAVVHRSNKPRHGTANSDLEKNQRCDILIRQNKITFVVITLVVIFLICHTPNAVYSVYKFWLSITQTFVVGEKIKNYILAFEISCQVLMSINCCAKFFIYTLAYDDYWTSLKSLKNCFQSTKAPGEQIINTSKHLFPSTKADVESLLNYSLSKKYYATQKPPEARQYRATVSSPRIHKPSHSSIATNDSNTPRLSRSSLAPSNAGGIELGVRMTRISILAQVERQQSIRSNKSCRTFLPSPLQVNLSRSKSLNIQSTMKHSPNCRLNKKF